MSDSEELISEDLTSYGDESDEEDMLLDPAFESSDDDDLMLVAAYASGLFSGAPIHAHHSRYSVKRTMVRRNNTEGWERLRLGHFDPRKIYPDAYFRRRFRISMRLFFQIADEVTRRNDYFKQKPNAAGKMGRHPYQKICAALKMLATGCSTDSLDREFRMSASVVMESLKHFVHNLVDIFGEWYLRSPDNYDTKALLQVAEDRGFPGMLGSIDCMHWQWEKCPVGWHGEHVGRMHRPTLILEAVVGQDLWFWHTFFGLPGSLNDINVLHRSPVFDALASGNAPSANFTVNGHDYHMGYYLADGIYPDWATIVKGVPSPLNDKERLFTVMQSAYRKDVERGFGVLQAKFAILKQGARMFSVSDLKNVTKSCIILHNMAIDDERGQPEPHPNDYDDRIPFHSSPLPGNMPSIQNLIANHRRIEDRAVHRMLQEDLIEHVWNKFGGN